uniref:CSON003691 protein n=1 Tax=Culicoides sonorensis TaxID=179676 RepID=A0A336LJM0_CULSO
MFFVINPMKLISLVFGISICYKFIAANTIVRPFRNTDICGRYNNHRVYLELNEQGILKAENITYIKNHYPSTISDEIKLPRQCNLELVTCPSCVIRILVSHSNINSNCVDEHDDHLLLFESPYDSTLSGNRICSSNVTFLTVTRTVTIRFTYQRNYTHAFTLEYFAEKNLQVITSPPYDSVISAELNEKIITSPFFPALYPRDYIVEYNLTCLSATCRIHIIFSDFLISSASALELYDSNGDQLDTITGLVARPKVLISTGSTLFLRFFANGGSGLGYKAKVKFINEELIDSTDLQPITDCGGLVDTFGGAITMMKMLQNETESKLYDCIWLIRPPNTYMHLKTHLMIKVDAFEKMAGPSELVIRQGLTSDKPEIEIITYPTKNLNRTSVVVPLSTGFYVHLRGVFGIDSRLAVIYTVFSYMNCFLGSEFLCENHRCIPIQLHCDGFDHCGDKSDEPESCSAEWASEPIDRRWYVHTPNYYFPKIDRYPDLKTATMIFIMSSMGLLTLISCLIVLLYKTGTRAREQRELQSQLQTISELLDNNNIRNDEPIDEPPTYEAPPEYDDVIKLGAEAELQRAAHGHRSGRKSRLKIARTTLRTGSNPTNAHLETENSSPNIFPEIISQSDSISPTEMERCQHISRLREELEGTNFFSATTRLDIHNINRPTSNQTTEATSYTKKSPSNWSPPPGYFPGEQGEIFNESYANGDTQPLEYQNALKSNNSEGQVLNTCVSISMSRQESFDSTNNQIMIESTTQQHCFIFHKSDSNATFSTTSSLESVDLNKVKEIGAYLLKYDSVPESISSIINGSLNGSTPTNVSSSCAGDCTLSKITATSLTSELINHNQCACTCQGVQEKEKFLHKNCTSLPNFFFCVNCGGNFSFQYINSSTSIALKQHPALSSNQLNSNLKLCDCLVNAPEIETNVAKSQSADQLMTFRRETEVIEPAKSHIGISNCIDSSIEAALDQSDRCESGF